MMDPDALRESLRIVFQQYPVLFSYMFGSQVTGRTHVESDIDLGVFLEASLKKEERTTVHLKLFHSLSQMLQTARLDLVILNEAPPLLAFEILRNGILIYCSDENARIEFQVRTLQSYEDTVPLRKILSEAVAQRARSGEFGKPVLKPLG